MQVIHTQKERRAAHDRKHKNKVKLEESRKRLFIGPLTFLEHHSSVTSDKVDVKRYAFYGGLVLTEREIRERVK